MAEGSRKRSESGSEREADCSERRVETVAADCRVQGSLFLFRQRWRRHFHHKGVGHSHAILDQNPTEAQL